MIPNEFIEQLLSKLDIVDVIDRYVPLRRTGQNYSACCPFHQEKTASFTVSPSKQFYHCFGCGAHGSSIGFMMEYHNMNFVEAVQSLADTVGISVPQIQQNEKNVKEYQQRRILQTSLEGLLQQAFLFYKHQLKQSPSAIAYLKERGLTGKIAAHFGLGYSPNMQQGLASVVSDYDNESMVSAGLVIEADEKYGRRDRFRGRVMFPIRNQRGVIVGFGARTLGKGEPKYLNSPETPLFVKGREVYGLYEARQSIKEHKCLLVVEGYMDVVSLAQYGIDYVVASLGTAITEEQIQKILKQTDNIYFCFDGDLAGRKAAWRAIENSLSLLRDDKVISFMFLPEKHDPDSYIRQVGPKAFKQSLFSESLPLSVFMIQELVQRTKPDTPEGRANLIRQAAVLLAKLSAVNLRFLISQRLAELAGVEMKDFESLVTQSLVSRRDGKKQYRLPKVSGRLSVNISLLSLKQIATLVAYPELAKEVCFPDSLVLPNELVCLSVLAEMVLQSDVLISSAQLLEKSRGTIYENLIHTAIHNEEINESLELTDEIREGFCRDNQRLLSKIYSSQVEELIAKSKNESLNKAEKRILLALLSQRH